MKVVEMRSMAPAVLSAEVGKLRRELLELRCKVALGEDVRPHRVREIRKEIARILTVLGEKAALAERMKA
ncbi:MAG: 50S ribosomal protein L29 [Planctomycetota bacterium]|jgi:large subunit ribosomal protein L29|nr:50S ribosomal protein L29 [Planctomycetota bacterium]